MYFVELLLEHNVFFVDDFHPFCGRTLLQFAGKQIRFRITALDPVMSPQGSTFGITFEFVLEVMAQHLIWTQFLLI